VLGPSPERAHSKCESTLDLNVVADQERDVRVTWSITRLLGPRLELNYLVAEAFEVTVKVRRLHERDDLRSMSLDELLQSIACSLSAGTDVDVPCDDDEVLDSL
jgi:hypothetical protein